MGSSLINIASRSIDAAPVLLGGLTVDEKLDRLADFYADCWVWRSEEADRMKAFEKRLSKLEMVHEDGPGGATYLMPREDA